MNPLSGRVPEAISRIPRDGIRGGGVSVSTALGRIPTFKELQEELKGQARMAAKVQESENKKLPNREGERVGWPCETTDVELRELQNEGMISAHWSFIRDTDVPKPGADERVMTKAWVERGLSLPCSEFFLSVLNTYGLQPHNICPNSYLLLSNFATLCEGHLGSDQMSGRMYPPHDSHESVRYWNAGWFYEKNISVPVSTKDCPNLSTSLRKNLLAGASSHACPASNPRESSAENFLLETFAEENFCTILRVPVSGEAAEEVPEDDDEEEEHVPRKAALDLQRSPRQSFRLAGASGEASAKKPKTVKPPPLNSKKAERERLKLLATGGNVRAPSFPAPRSTLAPESLVLRCTHTSTFNVAFMAPPVSGYDTRIARRIRHDEFYDKVVLPADEPLEVELHKEHDAEARPAESGSQNPSKEIFSELDEINAQGPIFARSFQKSEGETKWGHEAATHWAARPSPGRAGLCVGPS
ncbi:hypothetical protein QYE76_022689 [Lolium multiflorum]|uniref:Transposase (putative) gypsy type domain-containing protein n=1 Tax=Lolium multiflorum TaxID=4521 RepID=A0AAD8RBE5_LOLMU|nr:hypothetical protein QYE76_022689 [Lolium multiflorum]